MGKAKNPTIFSRTFNVDANKLAQLDVLDITLAIDTKLFIDPMLLRESSHKEFNTTANNEYHQHFEQVIKLLRASRSYGDPAWKAAQKLLSFPEVRGTCLGYGAGSIHGSGFGTKLSNRILSVAKQIVDIGVDDPDLFVAMALFEPDIGPDRISDMTTNIIFSALAKFNQRVLQALGLKGVKFEVNRKTCVFMLNPYEDKETPVILVPKDILRELPIAYDWDGIAAAASENEQLRNEVNMHIAAIWARKTKRDKSTLKREVLASKDAFKTLLTAVQSVSSQPYDIDSDPEGVVRWAPIGQQYANQYPLQLNQTSAKTLGDVFYIVQEIVTQFRQLIEYNGLNKELYRTNWKPRHESTAQRLFFAIAYVYCVANNIDVSPEIDTGSGKIDFKFATGFNERVLVEVKLSTNPKAVAGYTTQLEVYKVAQQTMRAIYLLIDVGSMGKKDKTLMDIRNKAAKCGDPLSELEFIDGTIKASASKR